MNALLGAAIALAVSLPAAAAPQRRAPAGDRSLTVFAAASLADAIGEIGKEHEREYPGARLRINAAGSQQLASQLEHGQQADLFVSADEAWMRRVETLGLVSGPPVAFASNRPVVIVSRTRGGHIRSLADLARPGVKLVLGAPAVPIGRYAREALEKLARQPGFTSDYAARALANVVSEEENVKGVAGKVQLGEADAGIVYVSDVTPALAPHVRVLEFPEAASVPATCWIAVLKGPREAAADEFVARLRSAFGQRVLAARGFAPTLER